MSYDYLIRGILVGDTRTGKSQILLQYTERKFIEEHNLTKGIEFGSKSLEVSGKQVILHIWDTAGQVSFRPILTTYYNSSAFCLLFFDLTNRNTFESIPRYYEEARNNASPVFILVGNKTDLAELRQVSSEEAQVLCDRLGMFYYESSAKDHTSANELFRIAAQAVVEKVLNSAELIEGVKIYR